VTFVDDYGHLPGEVAAALSAARAGDWHRIVVVFQPHRYSRTEALWPDFADAFEAADILFVTDLYPAGERPRPGVTGELVFRAVHERHPEADVRYVAALDAVAKALAALLQPGDLCVTLGAGDVTTLADRMLA
jgi:UDP-N-acetylmuramate--alanine ligase